MLGASIAVLPTPTVRPTKPAAADAQQQWLSYRWSLDNYNMHRHWDQEVIGALWKKFPNDKEIDTSGILPLSLMGRQALDHIEGKAKTNIMATEAYCTIFMRMMQRK